jgi:hypothetical protein
MDIPVETLWQISDKQLLLAYHKVRRAYAEQKFARDTERGRLQWQRAHTFVTSKGGVTERTNVVDASEEMAKKGQHVREMTRELDLIKCDVDLVAGILRARGMGALLSPDADDVRTSETPAADEAVASPQTD